MTDAEKILYGKTKARTRRKPITVGELMKHITKYIADTGNANAPVTVYNKNADTSYNVTSILGVEEGNGVGNFVLVFRQDSEQDGLLVNGYDNSWGELYGCHDFDGPEE